MRFITAFAVLIILSAFIFLSCRKKSPEGKIIITLSQSTPGEAGDMGDDDGIYPQRSQLYLLDPSDPDADPEHLTSGFFTACSPDISFDGRHMLFMAKKEEGATWQIWEMDLAGRKAVQITSGDENSADPAYLPGDRLVFSRRMVNDSLRSGYTLFTCKSDGSDVVRITFNPHNYHACSVLRDGRIISLSREVYPQKGESSMMVMRPDGTKSELFYKGGEILSSGLETEDGKVVFIESPMAEEKGKGIVMVNYNRPLHSRVDLTTAIQGDFITALPYKPGILLVSYRPSTGEKFALYDFDAERKKVNSLIYKDPEMNVLEAVPVRAHIRPKKLPSEVDNGVKTGLLFCQNISVTGLETPEVINPEPVATRVEIVGIDSSLGVVNVEKDGSFYFKIQADLPFRLKTLDKDGKTVNGPGSWIWLRPNERRGCVGCHEDHEMVPANRVAQAVKKQPVAVPVHVSGVKEKEVELE